MRASEMLKRLLACICGLLLLVGTASAATLLPNGEQTFVDANGAPLVNGRVYFYIPNSSTFKTTWQDSGQATPNANPIILDSAGRAIIYGAGSYRQVVKDNFGNTIWDQLTSDGSATSANWAGASAGTANAQTVTSTSFSQADGQTIFFRATATNTGALTINANGAGGIPVLQDTLAGPVQLLGGEVTSGDVYQVIYDALLGSFHLGAHPRSAPFISIAGGSTTGIGSLATPNVIVTGNAAITSFGSSASVNSAVYTVKFTGNSVLTYNATSMILPSPVNMVTAVGEIVTAIYLGSGNWQIIPSAPTGKVDFFNLAACPTGWVAANGITVAGGSVSPDLRGNFARGLDTSGTIDPSRTLNSFQLDAFQDHTHSSSFLQIATNASGGSCCGVQNFIVQSTTTGANSGRPGSETRPRNVALLACIKS